MYLYHAFVLNFYKTFHLKIEQENERKFHQNFYAIFRSRGNIHKFSIISSFVKLKPIDIENSLNMTVVTDYQMYKILQDEINLNP